MNKINIFILVFFIFHVFHKQDPPLMQQAHKGGNKVGFYH